MLRRPVRLPPPPPGAAGYPGRTPARPGSPGSRQEAHWGCRSRRRGPRAGECPRCGSRPYDRHECVATKGRGRKWRAVGADGARRVGGSLGAARRLVAGRVHRRRRPGIRGADPPALRGGGGRGDPAARRRQRRRASWPGRPPGWACRTSSGSTRRWPSWRRPGSEGAGRDSCGGPAPGCRSPPAPSTPWWPAWCSSTSSTIGRRSPRSAAFSSQAGGFCSSSTTRCSRRPTAAGSTTTFWRSSTGGSAPTSSKTSPRRRWRPGCFLPFVHRPLSRYVNTMADAGLLIERMEEPAPPAGFLERAAEYREAASIPRLLFLRARKVG